MAILTHPARIISVFALSLVLLAACGASQQPIDPYAQARADLAWQQQQQASQVTQDRAAVLEPIVRISLGTLLLVPFIVCLVALDAYRLRRRLVIADAAGKLPMPRSIVEQDPRPAIAALGAFHQTELARATPARMFSPPSQPSAPQLITNEPPTLTIPASTVDLSTLVTDWRPSLQSILLAVGPGGVRYTVHARDLCHVALAGATGGGKSNIMRLVLAQLQSAGARVVLADPHFAPLDIDSGDDWRPIERRLHLAPAVSASAIGDLLAWLATDELPQRLERRRNGQAVGSPTFLALDELPAIVADVKQAPEHMARLLREGRKANLFIVGAAQDWLAKTLGGSGAVRDCYRTAYYVGGDTTSARVLLDITGRVDDGQLGQGLAMLRSKATPTAELVRVPLASNEALYNLLDVTPKSVNITDLEFRNCGIPNRFPAASVMASNDQPEAKPEDTPDGASMPLLSTKALSAEQQRILSLFAGGEDVASIVRTVYNLPSTGGRAYQDKSREVQQALRAALGGA